MDTAPILYNEFPLFLKRYFPYKVQKISLNAGFTCPNRDGSKGYGGCTYCNNQTFNPEYCRMEKSVTQQLEEGKIFFAHKYPEMKYLAYFQAYTNTYGELEALKRKYEEALTVPNVVGLVIGTRPDCMPMPCFIIWKRLISILSCWWSMVLRVRMMLHFVVSIEDILIRIRLMQWNALPAVVFLQVGTSYWDFPRKA